VTCVVSYITSCVARQKNSKALIFLLYYRGFVWILSRPPVKTLFSVKDPLAVQLNVGSRKGTGILYLVCMSNLLAQFWCLNICNTLD
jgi:hypothetical protein